MNQLAKKNLAPTDYVLTGGSPHSSVPATSTPAAAAGAAPDLLLRHPHLLEVFHPKGTKRTLYVVFLFFFGGFPCHGSSKLYSSLDNDTHKGEHRFQPKDAPFLDLLRQEFTGGSVWAEP